MHPTGRFGPVCGVRLEFPPSANVESDPTSSYFFPIVLIVSMFAAAGCSWQHAYSSAQGWQRNQCYRLPDQSERERCLANTALSYDDYRRQSESAAKK